MGKRDEDKGVGDRIEIKWGVGEDRNGGVRTGWGNLEIRLSFFPFT